MHPEGFDPYESGGIRPPPAFQPAVRESNHRFQLKLQPEKLGVRRRISAAAGSPSYESYGSLLRQRLLR